MLEDAENGVSDMSVHASHGHVESFNPLYGMIEAGLPAGDFPGNLKSIGEALELVEKAMCLERLRQRLPRERTIIILKL